MSNFSSSTIFRTTPYKMLNGYYYLYYVYYCRPLDFPCVKATTICDYSITQKVGEKSSIIIYVHITKLALMAPAMVGNLLLCIAKENMFRLRPLMQRNADYLCTPLGKNTTVIIDHLTGNFSVPL